MSRKFKSKKYKKDAAAINSLSISASKKYYVRGMHCSSCEVLLEKDISALDGVEKVNASLKNNLVEVHVRGDASVPEISTLNSVFNDLGYTFYDKRPDESKLTKSDIKKIIFVFFIFVVLFYLFERSGVLMRFSVTPASSPVSYFVFGMLAGLSSCAALVGGILLSLSAQWQSVYNSNTKKSMTPFIYFNASRVLAFAILGGLLGLVGSALQLSIGVTSVLTLLISLLMLAIGFQMLDVGVFKKFQLSMPKGVSRYISDEQNFKGKYMPLTVGALTFFVPCGFTLITQSNALASGSIVQGSLMLTAFALGTLPILGLISFTSLRLYSNPAFSKKFSFFSGLLITFFALYTLNSQLNVLGLPSLSNMRGMYTDNSSGSALQTGTIVGDVQVMQMEAKAFEYYPKDIAIKAGVKTTWEIYDNGATGCAKAVYAHGLYSDVIYLKPGLNTVEFTPKKAGTYKISCSMGMVSPVTVTVF